jgi:hypothetical protein
MSALREADQWQISQAFADLGVLWGEEQAEGDDVGVVQVEQLARLLRAFQTHEQQEQPQLADLEEGSYTTPSGSIYYQDQQTVRELQELYGALEEQAQTGSPNLENQQALAMLRRVQSGALLSEAEISTMRKLLAKHAAILGSDPADGRHMMDADIPTARLDQGAP